MISAPSELIFAVVGNVADELQGLSKGSPRELNSDYELLQGFNEVWLSHRSSNNSAYSMSPDMKRKDPYDGLPTAHRLQMDLAELGYPQTSKGQPKLKESAG